MTAEFSARALAARTLGERLRLLREESGRTIEAAGAATKIHPRFLTFLESGAYDKLPGRVYAKQYLIAYAAFLGVSEATVIEEFEREYPVATTVNPTRVHPTSTHPTHQRAWVTAILGRRVGVGLAIFGILLYLGWEAVRLLVAPPLMIVSPPEPLFTNEAQVTVSGRTAPEATVTINGVATAVDDHGRFAEAIDLTPGDNTLAITAKRSTGRSRTFLRHITVTLPTPTGSPAP